jgi:outer membrane protein, multidrug efflux system
VQFPGNTARAQSPHHLAALVISLAGCNLGPDYHKPALAIPPQFRATPQTEAAAWPAPGWWSAFRSPELDRREAQAQAQNFDVAAAIARVDRADAQVRIASAPCSPPSRPRLPQVTRNPACPHAAGAA